MSENIDIKENIFNYLRQGMFKKDASVMAGISEATFYRWIEDDESFKSRVEASILLYKRSLIENMNTYAEKNGMLALKILQLRWPNEWGDHSITENSKEGETSSEKIAELLLKICEKCDAQSHV